jgi:hypothetical protein
VDVGQERGQERFEFTLRHCFIVLAVNDSGNTDGKNRVCSWQAFTLNPHRSLGQMSVIEIFQ